MTVAFFDLDNTLIRGNSGWHFSRYLYKEGRISRIVLLQILYWGVLFRLNIINMDNISRKISRLFCGWSEPEASKLASEWAFKDGMYLLNDKIYKKLEEHRSSGHCVVILTAVTKRLATALARVMGVDVDKVLSTEPEVLDNIITGRLMTPICIGHEKVTRACHLIRSTNAKTEDCYFYTDSFYDLPLLEVIGHPIVVNPDRKLRTIALRRNWPVILS